MSLSRWAVLLGLLGHGTVAKQSLWERLTEGAVALLQQTLGLVLAERIRVRARARPKILRAFTRLLIQDSRTIPLCSGLAKAFPGSRNQCGSNHGQLKIQTHYDLLSQLLLSFSLSGFNRNDQAAAQDVLALVRTGDLVLRDLGYFVVETFQRIALEERLLDFAASIVRLVEQMPETRSANHMGGQLLRSGTSPLLNHGEAQAAESKNDFIHKLKVCLKELRESQRALALIGPVPLIDRPETWGPLEQETDERIKIFVASIRTASGRE